MCMFDCRSKTGLAVTIGVTAGLLTLVIIAVIFDKDGSGKDGGFNPAILVPFFGVVPALTAANGRKKRCGHDGEPEEDPGA